MRFLNGFRLLTLGLAAALSACNAEHSYRVGDLQSLTLSDSAAKKYYFGFGQVLDGFMGNETKYDVKHTHDIFASGAGGNYESKTLVDRDFDTSDVVSSLRTIADKTRADDMYVQYSSGHGYEGGLAVGGDYDTLLDSALGMKAKEVVIFTMACYSGTEVETANQRRSQWQSWAAQGRTFFVMSSSAGSETSSTGPGMDDAQDGPEGSAGSAYGHSLWKSLSGEADGALDGIKDGFISLGEIAAFATEKTQIIGRHSPQVTGVYNPNLIMNKVPGAGYIAQQAREGGTGALSDERVQEVTQASDRLDAQWRDR